MTDEQNRETVQDYVGLNKAYFEACLRLAYYVDKHGGIPEKDQVRLFRGATLGVHDQDSQAIFELAEELRQYLLELGK